MKTNTLLAILIGILIAATIYSLWKLNSISKKVKSTDSNSSSDTSTSTSTAQRQLADSVSAKDLVSEIQKSLKNTDSSVQEVNLKFYKTSTTA